jgi:hypothetical protein
LADAIGKTLGKVARAVARAKLPEDPADIAARKKAADDTARTTADKAAAKVFAAGRSRDGDTEISGTRPPTAAERTAARVLSRALTTAGIRDRVATKTTSPIPPGRLRMRGALAREAQRAAGAIPTAEPFTRATRTPVPTPPLRLGIACDVSGSMGHFAGPVASTAWIMATAAAQTPVPADTATVIFGAHVRPITRPGTTPKAVTEFAATDDWEAIDTAIDALDGALGLSQPGAARLLVIVSDGYVPDLLRRNAQRLVDRLRATGCAVLWIAPHDRSEPLTGATVHVLTDPTTTAQAIGRAATTALRATTPEQRAYIAAELSPIRAFAQAQIMANESGRPRYIQHTGSAYGIYSDMPQGEAVTTVTPNATPPGLVSGHPDVVTATEAALEEAPIGRPYWIGPTSTHTWGLFNTPQPECS